MSIALECESFDQISVAEYELKAMGNDHKEIGVWSSEWVERHDLDYFSCRLLVFPCLSSLDTIIMVAHCSSSITFAEWLIEILAV